MIMMMMNIVVMAPVMLYRMIIAVAVRGLGFKFKVC